MDEKAQVYSIRHVFGFELSRVIFPPTPSHPCKSQLFRQGSLVAGGTHAQCCGEFGGSWHHVPLNPDGRNPGNNGNTLLDGMRIHKVS